MLCICACVARLDVAKFTSSEWQLMYIVRESMLLKEKCALDRE